jgi:hypothetical protein
MRNLPRYLIELSVLGACGWLLLALLPRLMVLTP